MTQIEFDVVPELVENAEVVGYLDAKIEQVRQMVADRPRPPLSDNLSRYEVEQWCRRFLSRYAKVVGNLEAAVAFHVITPAYAKQLETRLKCLLQYHIGVVMIGR
jgi:hypothetical protein